MVKISVALAVPALAVVASCSSASSSAAPAGTQVSSRASESTAAGPSSASVSASAAESATAGDPASGSPTAVDAGAPGAGCEALAAATVSGIVGFTVGPPKTGGADPVILCTYTGKPTGMVLIRKQTGVDPAAFTGDRDATESIGEKTADAPGIGDTAYSSLTGSGELLTSTVVTMHGSNEVLVSLSGPKSSVAMAGALAKAALQAYGF